MTLGTRDLAMWYPKPLIAFEGIHIVWMNRSAGFLVDGTHIRTLPLLLGEEAAASLAGSVTGGGDWEGSNVPSIGGARAGLTHVCGEPYIELTLPGQPEKNAGTHGALLSNAGELMAEPLSVMRLALEDLDQEMDKYCGSVHGDGPLYMLNLSREDMGGSRSLPLAFARIYRSWGRLALLSRSQTALSDLTELPGVPGPWPCVRDVSGFLAGMIPRINAMLGKRIWFRLSSDLTAPAACGLPAEALRGVAIALMSAAASDAPDGGEIPFAVKTSADAVRLCVPVSAERRGKASGTEAFTRAAGSAGGGRMWLDLMLLERLLRKYGGSALFTSAPNGGGDRASLVAALPKADAHTFSVLESPSGDEGRHDHIYLSELLDNSAFFPDWCR